MEILDGTPTSSSHMNCFSDISQLIDQNWRERVSIDFTEDTPLLDFGLSSIDFMELVEQIEDHFDIAIPLNDLENFRTLGDLAARVQELLDAT